jgi:hypothetical protein
MRPALWLLPVALACESGALQLDASSPVDASSSDVVVMRDAGMEGSTGAADAAVSFYGPGIGADSLDNQQDRRRLPVSRGDNQHHRQPALVRHLHREVRSPQHGRRRHLPERLRAIGLGVRVRDGR